MLKSDFEILERRYNHLVRRVEENPDRNMSYDRKEAAALRRLMDEAMKRMRVTL